MKTYEYSITSLSALVLTLSHTRTILCNRAFLVAAPNFGILCLSISALRIHYQRLEQNTLFFFTVYGLLTGDKLIAANWPEKIGRTVN